jgi:hypothetical protein
MLGNSGARVGVGVSAAGSQAVSKMLHKTGNTADRFTSLLQSGVTANGVGNAPGIFNIATVDGPPHNDATASIFAQSIPAEPVEAGPTEQ